MAIKITLSSANMGDVDELDFDLWARYVVENVDEACGVQVATVRAGAFGEPGADTIEGATYAERDAIRAWLSVTGWDSFCGGPWETMRAEAERHGA